jgi:hypothetical protein
MKLTIDEMVAKIETFAKNHVVPNLASDKSRFMLGFAWMVIRAKLRSALDSLPKDGTVRDEDGRIDVEKLRECVKGGFDLTGSVLLDERLPLRFTQSDADQFFAELA